MLDTIGKRLSFFGSQRFKTKKEFAEALGMSYENLYQYLSDKAKPGPEIIARLTELHCNLNWLFSGKDDCAEAEKSKYRKLTYVPLGDVEQSVNKTISYCVMGTVPAGISEVNEYNDWQEGDDLDFDPKTHFYLSIDKEFGYSMMPLVGPGDKVLVSFNSRVKDGDLVAARWDKTKGALKVYTENKDVPDLAVLTSYNQAVPPLFIKKKDLKAYKVVLIKKT